MARFRTSVAVHFGSTRVAAGRTVADSPANSVSGDVIWNGLSASSLPLGMVPLDAGGTTMKNASPWAGTPIPCTISGVNSIDA